jgi:hypothetical protein
LESSGLSGGLPLWRLRHNTGKLRLQAFSTPAVAVAAASHMHEYVVAYPAAFSARPVDRLHPAPRSQLVANPPAGPGLLHEVKHDGFRILARKQQCGPARSVRQRRYFES